MHYIVYGILFLKNVQRVPSELRHSVKRPIDKLQRHMNGYTNSGAAK